MDDGDEARGTAGCLGIALALVASVAASVAVGLNHGAWAGWAFMACCLAILAAWFIVSAIRG